MQTNTVATRKKKSETKMCVKCTRTFPQDKFYSNRDWTAQGHRDAWCKECAWSFCRGVETLRQYCFENNRKWDEGFYDLASKKAQYALSRNDEYLNPKTTKKKKEAIAEAAIAHQFFTIMNMANFYEYVDNISDDSKFYTTTFDVPVESDGGIDQPKYNVKWRGYFTKDQIKTLEDAYTQYEEDFALDNVNIRDYTRKTIKASLNVDILEDKVRRGEASIDDLKAAQKMFDDLSKSSNFAACKRKPGESTGFGSLGEIILRLETNGQLKTEGFTFPKDDVDKVTADFRHTLAAIGEEGQMRD